MTWRSRFTVVGAIPARVACTIMRAPRLNEGRHREASRWLRAGGCIEGPAHPDPWDPRPVGSLAGAVPWNLDAALGADVSLPCELPSQASAPSSLMSAKPRGMSLRGSYPLP